jgi:hypothetical protein
MATPVKNPTQNGKTGARPPSSGLAASQSVPQLNAGPPGSARGPRQAEKPIRFAQGAGEGAYREVIHASPQKIASIHTLLGEGKQYNLDVSSLFPANRVCHQRNGKNSSTSCNLGSQASMAGAIAPTASAGCTSVRLGLSAASIPASLSPPTSKTTCPTPSTRPPTSSIPTGSVAPPPTTPWTEGQLTR